MASNVSYTMKKYQERLEQMLPNVFPDELSDDPTVKASLYSLLAGGKRIRPVLMYMFADLLGVDLEIIDDYAVAIEMTIQLENNFH